MKLIILVISPVILFFQDDFYVKVLKETKRYGPFLVIPVKTKKYNGTIVTENLHLFEYYEKKNGWNKNTYVNYLKDKLAAKDTIYLQDEFIEGGESFITPPLEVDSEQSIEKIIDKYFTTGSPRIMKEEISFWDRNKIIRKLFENKIACRLNHESGMPAIME